MSVEKNGVENESSMTHERKHFQTPPCLNLFLDVEATETGIDFDPLPEDMKALKPASPSDGNDGRASQRRPRRKRTPTGHVIRKMLSVR